MFLKSLTVRGFKSFADKTVLDFEPGITVIVGPNGSGKSNLVDAIAWVLGEQGAKSLRGGKMEDVIFAGSGVRPGLGRAEVTLTIDNAAGLLPVDYSEVSVSRLLYRSGESEYALNGTSCRLLDITDLLSDTGVGRELHTILAQGHLDDVLHGRPEDRRASVEEAAGIYKHRRRKERALRKLATLEQHLVRLTDLVAELRRQLKPLEQQAETARRAAAVAAELREVRLTLGARELDAARRRAEELEAHEAAYRARVSAAEAGLDAAQTAEQRAQAALEHGDTAAAAATEIAHRLTTVRERLRGTLALAEQRARDLARHPEEPVGERSADDLVGEAERVTAERAEVVAELAASTGLADMAEQRRIKAQAALAVLDASMAKAWRSQEEGREHELELRAQLAGLDDALARSQQQSAELEDEVARLDRRTRELTAETASLEEGMRALEDQEAVLTERLARAEEGRDGVALRVEELAADLRRREGERDAAGARRLALETTIRAAAGDVLAALGQEGPPGLVALATELRISPGYEVAVAAALGADADALVGSSEEAAAAALERLHRVAARRAILLHPGSAQPPPRSDGGNAALGEGPRLLRWIAADGPTADVLHALLGDVLVADDLAAARGLLARHRGTRVVTRQGEVLAPGRFEGGAPPEAGTLAARRAADEAAGQERAAAAAVERIAATIATATAELDTLSGDVEAATTALHDSDARIAATVERLAVVHAGRQDSAHALEAAHARRSQLAVARGADTEARMETAARIEGLHAVDHIEPGVALEQRDDLAAELERASTAAVEARVILSAVEERHRLLERREVDLRARAAAAAIAAEGRARELLARQAGAARASDAATLARQVLERLERSLADAVDARDSCTARVVEARAGLAQAGGRRRVLAAELEVLHNTQRSGDEARLEARLRAEELARRLVEAYAVETGEVLAEYLVDNDARESLAEDDPRGADDAELRRRATALDRRLTLLGRVNPLALEEFKALEERYAFLSGQLQDLRESRRDLLKVVRAVDERVREVFATAFADVAREFERTFALLFPGGDGRLVLTDAEDMLETGIEIEARPPGKRVRRLSLLSGGERSLVALAFCFAIFRARPSPFYVLDEVEAALDDVNLRRFIDLLLDVREQAQLLVVSHQRRTMEAADALYGVSMQAGGVSKVVSERLREVTPARRQPRARVHEPEIADPGIDAPEPDEPALGEADGDAREAAPHVLVEQPVP